MTRATPAPAERLAASAIARAVRSRVRPAMAFLEESLDQIARSNPALNAFRETFAEFARERAHEIDRLVAAGRDPGPLAGVPLAIKDNIATTHGTTACGSRMLAGYRSPFTATAVERLEAAGAIIVGRTNCDEFAMGSSTEHCAFGCVRNPWDLSRVPGGSSGGSACAVAAGLVPVALGSDTGGSIRQPAALCGVVGLKPSYGRVSRWGLVAFGSSLDQIGPLALNVRDAALLLAVMSGADVRDSTCAERPTSDLDALIGPRLDEPVEGLRIGVAPQHRGAGNHPGVERSLDRALETLERMGAQIVEVELALTEHAIATYYVIAPAEASSNLARYDGIRYGHRTTPAPGESLAEFYGRTRAEGFGAEVERRLMLGTYVLSAGYRDAYYRRALQVRRLIAAEYERAFERCHAIIGPTSPSPAFAIGARTDPLSMYLGDVYTTGANIAGICAVSLPAGFTSVEEGAAPLPVGVQLQSPAFAESTLLRIAQQLESAGLHEGPSTATVDQGAAARAGAGTVTRASSGSSKAGSSP